MQIAVLKERRPGEARVAATPDTVKKLLALGCQIVVESGAGAAASISDADYTAAGATIAPDAAAACANAEPVSAMAARPIRTDARARREERSIRISSGE